MAGKALIVLISLFLILVADDEHYFSLGYKI